MNRNFKPVHTRKMEPLNLTEAVDMFVMTKFDQCFHECTTIINTAKSEPEQERNHKLIEAATALGVQALAETDSWYCVVAFITDVYDSVDLCPPSIIQLCTLLHAQVKEYLPCHKVVEMWLKNPHNQKHKQYSQVVRTYAYHILCPTGSYDLLKEIAENCDSLTPDERAALLQLSQTKRYEESKLLGNETDCPALDDTLPSNVLENASEDTLLRYRQSKHPTNLSHIGEQGDNDCNIAAGSNVTNTKNGALKRSWDLSRLQAFIKWLYEAAMLKLNYFRHPGFSLFMMGILAVWALIQTQSGDPVSSLGRFVILWRMFLQRIGLFLSNK